MVSPESGQKKSRPFRHKADYEPIYYRDTGCKYHPKCLECPFPDCIAELNTGQAKRQVRLRQILTSGGNLSMRELTEKLGVSKRTLYRDLKELGLQPPEGNLEECNLEEWGTTWGWNQTLGV